MRRQAGSWNAQAGLSWKLDKLEAGSWKLGAAESWNAQEAEEIKEAEN